MKQNQMRIRLDFGDIPETLVQIRKLTTIVMEQLLISDIVQPKELNIVLVRCIKILLIKVKSYTHILEKPENYESHDGAIKALSVYIDLLAQHYNLMCHIVKENEKYGDIVLSTPPCEFFPEHTIEGYGEKAHIIIKPF